MNILTKENVRMYAIKHYTNPHCLDEEEFLQDFYRIGKVKTLLRRYNEAEDLTERLMLIVNHFTILFNVFDKEAIIKLLFYRFEREFYPVLKACLIFFNYEPKYRDEFDKIEVDNELLKLLRVLCQIPHRQQIPHQV